MPEDRPLMVLLIPVPVVITAPGLLVRVQVPEAGRPVKVTLPVDTLHVGWIMAPRVGAAGVTG